MALQRVAFPLVLQSPSTGSALVGASATITAHVVGGSLGSGAAATIYTEETGSGKTASNVITTDNTGRWTQGSSEGYKQYWIEEGRYDILISGTGLTSVYITRESVTSEKPPLVLKISNSSAITAVPGEMLELTVSSTVTLPKGPADATIGVFSLIGEVTVKTTSSERILGDFLPETATSCIVGKFYHVIFQNDGTRWLIVAGTPVNENTYSGGENSSINVNETEAKAGKIFSATRSTIVVVTSAEGAIFNANKKFAGRLELASQSTPIWVPAGQTLTCNVAYSYSALIL